MSIRKKTFKLTPIARILPSALKRIEPTPKEILADLLFHWPSIVGSEMGRRSGPIALRGGSLTISVRSSSVASELQFRQREIIENIRSRLPGITLLGIRFQIETFSLGPRG